MLRDAEKAHREPTRRMRGGRRTDESKRSGRVDAWAPRSRSSGPMARTFPVISPQRRGPTGPASSSSSDGGADRIRSRDVRTLRRRRLSSAGAGPRCRHRRPLPRPGSRDRETSSLNILRSHRSGRGRRGAMSQSHGWSQVGPRVSHGRRDHDHRRRAHPELSAAVSFPRLCLRRSRTGSRSASRLAGASSPIRMIAARRRRSTISRQR